MNTRAGRICMLVHGHYPVGEPRVARQARAALNAGWNVDIVSMRRPGEPASELVDGATVHRLPLSHRRGGGGVGVVAEYVGFTAMATVKVARLACSRAFDVVHVNNPPDFLAVAGLLPRLRGARTILDVHDLAPDMFTMRFGERRGARSVNQALRLVERLATAASDRVLTVHEPYRRELEARGVPARKLGVVMNSLDEAVLPPVDQGATSTDPTAFRVVYHGTVTPPYGIDVLVEAAALALPEIPSLRLQILGAGDAIPRARARARELGIDERVEITGEYVPHREALAQVRGADVGVVPNLGTGRLARFALSTKLLEYVALGVPVVASRLPTLLDYFHDHEILFVNPGDARALADGLVRTAHDPTAAAARATAASRRYESYRWEVSARYYVAVLEELRAG